MEGSIQACERSVVLLCGGEQAHYARKVLWIVCGAPRAQMGVGSEEVLVVDGDRVYGVCAAVWTDVEMGSDCDYELGVGKTGSGGGEGDVVVGRVCSGECDVEPILCDSF